MHMLNGTGSFNCREKFSTGVLTLDNILGGGIPRGRIIEIYGPESSGKTSLALCIMAEAQKKGHYVAMIDAEHAFDEVYAAALGLDVKGASLTISKPETGEDSLEVHSVLPPSCSCFAVVCGWAGVARGDVGHQVACIRLMNACSSSAQTKRASLCRLWTNFVGRVRWASSSWTLSLLSSPEMRWSVTWATLR
jgi:hypothetical protein